MRQVSLYSFDGLGSFKLTQYTGVAELAQNGCDRDMSRDGYAENGPIAFSFLNKAILTFMAST